MKSASSDIYQFLSLLGLSEEEAEIYLVLRERGVSTTLEISRATNISRTQAYRLLEKMKKRGLVEELVDEHRLMAKAVEVDQLERLIKEKEHHLSTLRHLFPQVKESLMAKVGQNQPKTKVLFYRGKRGLQQMIWNTLRAEKECVGYTYRVLSEITGLKFALQWRDEFVRRNLFFRDIYSDEHLLSEAKAPEEYKAGWPKAHFASRYLPPKVLNINHQVDIYNEVTSYYNWYEGEIFGVEIYNQKIAALQKQLFEIVWKIAKPRPEVHYT